MKISREDFEIIFWIEFMGYGDPSRLSGQMNKSEEGVEKRLRGLEERGLIKIELRDGKIYGSSLTSRGVEVFNDKQYLKWKLELGY